MNKEEMIKNHNSTKIAIIGMSGRFPGANTIEEFWKNLQNGVESISFFSKEEAEWSFFDHSDVESDNYIGASGILNNIDMFDANFFGFNPGEAEIMDPQQKIFLECTLEALEGSGYFTDLFDGLIGIYASAGLNTYFLNNIYPNRNLMEKYGTFNIMIGNNKDLIPMLVSYKLNLKGPCINVQTACSSSLVAVHLASQSLLNGECDIAIAGGITVKVPERTGYAYKDGMILSPDGHCRVFDEKAGGTVFSNGVGVVILKRLADAIDDRDCIHAVIRGSAINNDGSFKAGFTAPGVTGQMEVVVEAMGVAGVLPDDIGYMEAHGTGTEMGDPIEITALTKAFGNNVSKRNHCPIGSVKTNIGHTDVAAGIAGLIKTVMIVKTGVIPPSLNFDTPSSRIDFAGSPFFVNNSLIQWDTSKIPRIAGVSSFGFGGTNAHVILEEAPTIPGKDDSGKNHLLLLSAKTAFALNKMEENLAIHFSKNPDINLADASYTLQVGRKMYKYRKAVVVSDVHDAITRLSPAKSKSGFTGDGDEKDRPVLFVFSGVGSHYPGMTLGLYRYEDYFKKNVDTCAEMFRKHTGMDIRKILYPLDNDFEKTQIMMNETWSTQWALFTVELALATLWKKWGIKPGKMAGRGTGEYVAAHLAGIFSIEDAFTIVALRAKFMKNSAGNSMPPVSIAKNESESIQNAVIQECREELSRCKLHPPHIPFLSGSTGTWITDEEAVSPDYWISHLQKPDVCIDTIGELIKEHRTIFLEMGSGKTLNPYREQKTEKNNKYSIVSSVRNQNNPCDDYAFILGAAGMLWVEGCAIDWKGFYQGQERKRIPLPAYPFERKRYWIDPLQEDFHSKTGMEKESGALKRDVRPELTNAYQAPANKVEELIADIWQEYLGIQKIGINDNFFELSGNSLFATQIVSRINKIFQVNLSLKELFENPTISFIVERIVNSWGGFDVAEEIAATFYGIQNMSDEELKVLSGKENV